MFVRAQYGSNTSAQSWGEWNRVALNSINCRYFIQSGNNSNSLVKWTDEFISAGHYTSFEQQVIFILVAKTQSGQFALYALIGYATGSTRSMLIPIKTHEGYEVSFYSSENNGYWFKVLSSQFGYKVSLFSIGNISSSFMEYLEMVPYVAPST